MKAKNWKEEAKERFQLFFITLALCVAFLRALGTPVVPSFSIPVTLLAMAIHARHNAKKALIEEVIEAL